MDEPSLSSLDDDALIRRVAGSDRAAFTALLERHWAPLYRYLGSLAKDPAAAEDALQEAFISVWRSAAGFRGEAGGRTWLYTIARNALHRGRRRAPDQTEALTSLDELGAAAGWGDQSSGDRVLAALEDRDRVRKAMRALSAEDNEVLLLVDVEELTAEEAARALEISVAAVKSRLHRARLRLCAELGHGKEERDGG